jgi:putative oxidoreductase
MPQRATRNEEVDDMSIGLLILRGAVGVLFIGHGTQKLFGWFGGGGLRRTGPFFESQDYRPGRVMALLAGLAETGAGFLLVLGLFTPLAAAGVIGVMLNAGVAVHARNGVWNAAGGFELPLTNAAVATAIAFTGPGRYSIGNLIGFSPDPVASGLFALVLGVVSGIVLLGMRQAAPAALAEPITEVPQQRSA